MRRRRQLLTVGTTNVSVGSVGEEVLNSNVASPRVCTLPPCAAADTSGTGEGPPRDTETDGYGVSTEVDEEPPLKRFRLPDKVLSRIEGPAVLRGSDALVKDRNDAEGNPAGVIRCHKLSSGEYRADAGVGHGVTEPRKPLVSVSRLPRHPAERCRQLRRDKRGRTGALSATGTFGSLLDGKDDVIRFDSVENGDCNPSSSDLSCSDGDSEAERGSADAAGSLREVGRHFAGYDSEDLPPLSGSTGEEASESEEYEEIGEESEEDSKGSTCSLSSGREEMSDGPTKMLPGMQGFGLQQRQRVREKGQTLTQYRVGAVSRDTSAKCGTAAEALQAASGPLRYCGVSFEMHINHAATTPCHHTLLHVRSPITVQGPCCIVGFGIGEVTVGGFFLGRKHITLLSNSQKLVITPVQPLKGKNAALESLPAPKGPLCSSTFCDPVVVAPPVSTTACRLTGTGESSAALTIDDGNVDVLEKDGEALDVEMFGTVDWDWVEAALSRFQGRHAGDRSCVALVVQPYSSCGRAPTRRRYLVSKKVGLGQMENVDNGCADKLHADSFIDVPLFLSRQPVPNIDAALLPNVVPAIVKQRSGAFFVVGSKDIGKSTLCRFLANALLSQHGVCYWLELDIGQPEFGPPGVLSLYCVSKPLSVPHDEGSADFVRGYYLGGARIRCPIAAARSLVHICAAVEQVRKRYPVIVNTHGWVLSTGRRLTVEAIRRLQPSHIIHLAREQEEQWACSSTKLMDPVSGLNSSVVNKRFLVHKRVIGEASTAATGKLVGIRVPDQLPHTHSFTEKCCRGSTGVAKSSPSTEWSGTVHTVHVVRDEGLLRKSMQPKASTTRRDMWRRYLAPILEYYEKASPRGGGTQQVPRLSENKEQSTAEEQQMTTLFEGKLCHFDSLVFTDVTDVRDLTDDFICAALDHSVVAFSIRLERSPSAQHASATHETRSSASCNDGAPCRLNCRCLVDLPNGFPVTCFGVVESSERDMQLSGEIRIRLPMTRDVMHKMLSVTEEGKRVCVSLACTLADRSDTGVVEAFFRGCI